MVLQGIRVIDLTRIVSGPFCTALLGDFGAEIVKIESPDDGGDALRSQGEIRDGVSWYFANFNRNKKSVTLDLRSETGRDLLAKLIRSADVIIDNYRPGVLAQIGFPSEQLEALRPGIIHCNINGFGTAGPYADRPAFDFVVQAMSGFMSVNGAADSAPMRSGAPIADLVAGLYAALGVIAALLQRTRNSGGGSPTGERVSVSMLSSMVSLLGFHAANYLASGVPAERTGNDHLLVAPYGLFQTADGTLAIAPSHEAIYARLVKTLGLEQALADPDFATNKLRLQHRDALKVIIEGRTKQRSSAHWVEFLNRAGVPCGPVYGLADVFADPQVTAEEMVRVLHQPDGAQVKILGFPVKLRDAPCEIYRPVPECGEHTAAILTELGVSAQELEQLRLTAVI